MHAIRIKKLLAFLLLLNCLPFILFGKELRREDFVISDSNGNSFYLLESYALIREDLGEPKELLYSFHNLNENNVQDGYQYNGIRFYMTNDYGKWNTERIIVSGSEYFVGQNQFQIGLTSMDNILEKLGHSNMSLYTDPKTKQIKLFYKMKDADLFPEYYEQFFKINGVFCIEYKINNDSLLLDECELFVDFEM